MKKILKLSLYVSIALSLMKSNTCISQNYDNKKHNYEPKLIDQAYANDENEVKSTIKHFMAVKGNYDVESTEKIVTNKASYTIHLSEGSTASVKSHTITYVYGVPLSNNIDYFTLKKKHDIWEIVSSSFTSTPITLNKMNFDLMSFAKDYAKAWSSQIPDSVALFYAEDGSLIINNDKRSIGRTAIAKNTESFMNAFPDLVVSVDRLISTLNGIEFHWTLTGTNTGVNGTGKKVKISGFELWQIDNNGLIKQSKGSFDIEDYNKQLKNGFKNQF